VMVNFVPGFVSQRLLDAQRNNAPQEEQTALLNAITVQDVVDHIEHIARVAGKAHVGFGSDLDGFGPVAPALSDVTVFPHIVDALGERGWTDMELSDLMSGNILRVMRSAEATASALSSK